MMFWLAGDLGWATHPVAMAIATLLVTLLVHMMARPLDVLATGETTAQSLGLDLTRWRILIVLFAGGLTAGAVIQGGTIGFIGLVIPHFVRLAFGTAAHRIVVPAAALAGGTLLAAADLVARTAAAPRQLPVGAIMALLGVDFPGAAAQAGKPIGLPMIARNSPVSPALGAIERGVARRSAVQPTPVVMLPRCVCGLPWRVRRSGRSVRAA